MPAVVAVVAVLAEVAKVALATVPVTLPPVIELSPAPDPKCTPVMLPEVLMGLVPNAARLAATLALP